MRFLFLFNLSLFSLLFGSGQTSTEPSMATDASPRFEVAVIKLSDPNSARQGWSCESEGHHVTCVDVTVNDLVAIAYGIHSKQLVGAPNWSAKAKFDIHGIPDLPGVPNAKQVKQMWQKLLADRFHLVFHREMRDMPVYAMTVVKGGPILTPADPHATGSNTGNSGGIGFRILKSTNISMADLAQNLSFYEDRPVVEQTSLTGRYNFSLMWTYDVSQEDQPGMPPSLFTAIKEQIGLWLDAVRGPVEAYVVDQVERPSGN